MSHPRLAGTQGWIVIFCFVLSTMLLYIHSRWLGQQTRLILSSEGGGGRADEALPAARAVLPNRQPQPEPEALPSDAL